MEETMSAERGSVAASVENQTMVLETASMLNNHSATFVGGNIAESLLVLTSVKQMWEPIGTRKYLGGNIAESLLVLTSVEHCRPSSSENISNCRFSSL